MSGLFRGPGTIYRAANLRNGETAEPVAATLTQTVPVAPAPTAKGANSIPVAALGVGVRIPSGTYLDFKSGATGKVVSVRLSADAVAPATSLSVFATPAIIAAGSIAEYPPVLLKRTAIEFSLTGDLASQNSLEDEAWEENVLTTKGADISLPGAFTRTAGYLNAREQLVEGDGKVFFWIENLPPNTDYAKGEIIKGVATIKDMPLSIPADGFIQGDVMLRLDGKPEIVPPVPTA